MKGTFIHLLWFTVVASALAYVIFLAYGQVVFASASGADDPVVIRDELGPGSHHIHGMITVPRTCDELRLDVEHIAPLTYKLVFTTWRDPSVSCRNERIPRAFNTMLLAPASGVEFIATQDGTPLLINVVPVIHH